MAFTPNDLARIVEQKAEEEVAPGWTQRDLDAHWKRHLTFDPGCEHHCCCCCSGLAAGEHF